MPRAPGLHPLPLVPAKAGTQCWIPACPGMSGVCCALSPSLSPIHLSNSPATFRLMVRSAPKERVSNHGQSRVASFETPAFGGLLRMRAEVANAARARLASSSARPRESGDPVLDSRLRGNERSMLRALAISLSDSLVKQPSHLPPHGEERSEGARLEPWAIPRGILRDARLRRAPQDEGGGGQCSARQACILFRSSPRKRGPSAGFPLA